jgi:hypothetical protein
MKTFNDREGFESKPPQEDLLKVFLKNCPEEFKAKIMDAINNKSLGGSRRDRKRGL